VDNADKNKTNVKKCTNSAGLCWLKRLKPTPRDLYFEHSSDHTTKLTALF